MHYRYTNSSGQVTFSDTMPVSAGKMQVDVIENGKVIKTIDNDPYADSKSYINITKKHIPKTLVYIEYLEYLMMGDRRRFDNLLEEMKRKDPKTYEKLHKAGLFRKLTTEKRLSNALDLTVGVFDEVFLAGKPGTAVATWTEKTLTDFMKKDGFLPPDVLGDKATTLPKHVPRYSSSRLAQWSRQEDARLVQVMKTTQKMVSERPVLNASATALSRLSGSLLSFGIAALDPEAVSGVSAIQATRIGGQLIPESVSRFPAHPIFV